MQKILAAVDYSLQVQMNQWKIVWLPVWIKSDLLLEVAVYLVRVPYQVFPPLFTLIPALLAYQKPEKTQAKVDKSLKFQVQKYPKCRICSRNAFYLLS